MVVALAALLHSHPCRAAEPAKEGAKATMQAKLQAGQTVLGALATGDFGTLERSAAELVKLSNRTNWYSRQTPEYDLFLSEFRRQAGELAAAAHRQNLDQASLAYVQMTLSCVSCHKYIRPPQTGRPPSRR